MKPPATLPRLVFISLAAAVCCVATGVPVAAQSGRPAATIAERLGYPRDAKLLILHADDLGVAHSVNTASLEALERGIVSSASVMMPTPWVSEIAEWARRHPDHDLGLHLTLTSEWETYRWGPVAPIPEVPTLVDSVGTLPRDTPTAVARASAADVERELRAQVERAHAFGLRPTHLDSHMRVLMGTPELYAAYVRVARSYGLPFIAVRGADGRPPAGIDPDRDVVLDAIITAGPRVLPGEWMAFYLDAIGNLKPGVTLMLVHLGRDDAELRAVMAGHEAWGAGWRQRDYDILGSAEFRGTLQEHGVRLVRWKDLQRALTER